MKDTGDLFSKICDMENLRKAHKNAKRGKGWYKEVKQVDQNLEKALRALQDMLINHTYHTSHYETFMKTDGQKERDRFCRLSVFRRVYTP